MLRAIGLGSSQLMSMLIYEQAIVLGVGTGVGTGLGVLASRLFVPFLQVRAVAYPDTPPFIVQIAWTEVAIVCGVAFGLLIAVVGVTLVLSRRLRLFEVVKLGEAV
jgi:putative ABC transport system permease protein